MSRIIYTSVISLVILFKISAFGEGLSPVDSLKVKLALATNDSIRYEIYLDVITEYLNYDIIQAEEYAYKALDFTKKKKWKNRTIQANIYIALCKIARGKNSKAIDILNSTYKEAEKIKDYDLMAYSGFILIRTLILVNDTTLAVKYSNNVLLVIEKLKNRMTDEEYNNRKASIYGSLGSVYTSMNKLDSAIYCFEQALNNMNWVSQTETINALGSLGKVYILKGDYKKAEELLRKSYELARKIKSKNWELRAEVILGNILFETQEFDSCVFHLNNAIEIANELNLPNVPYLGYLTLSKLYESRKQYALALKMYKLYKQFSDTLILDNNTKEIKQIQDKLQFNEEMKLYEKEKRILKMKYYIIASLFVLGFVVFLLLFMIQRNKSAKLLIDKIKLENENESLNSNLQLVNQELTSKIMYMIKRNKLVEEVTVKLLNLKYKMKKANADEIMELITELQTSNEDNLWDDFEIRFSKIHPSFYDRLMQQFPDISPSEKRLCAYIRMNLNSKDIAFFTGLQSSSIDVAKTRLRKKLNLSNTNFSLEQFLSQI